MKESLILTLLAICLLGCQLETECSIEDNKNICNKKGETEETDLILCIDGFWKQISDRKCGCNFDGCEIDSTTNAGFECKSRVRSACNQNGELVSCRGNQCGECLDGSSKCSGDGKSVFVCKSGGWDDVYSCALGCEDGRCIKRQNEKRCETGDYACHGDIAKLCINGSWTEADCSKDGLICMRGLCRKPCKNSEHVCNEDRTMMSICNENAWIDITCEPGQICSDGKCSEACLERDVYCDAQGKLKQCSGNAWTEVTKACSDSNESVRCLGNKLEKMVCSGLCMDGTCEE